MSFLPSALKNTDTWAAVERHHRERWHSDYLSAAIARQFFDGSEYFDGDLENGEHYFIPVYETSECVNGVIRWSYVRRNKLDQEIRTVYDEEHLRGGMDWERRASRRVNALLQYFPADTWTPFVSLAAHHMMTWILHEQGEGEIKNAVETNHELCLLAFKVNETEFYKLKELRSFNAKREQTFQSLNKILRDKLSTICGVKLLTLRVGDELLTITVNRNVQQKSFIDIILRTVASSNLQILAKLVQVPIGRLPSKMRNRDYWVVNGSVAEKEHGFGFISEDASVGRAEWEPHLYKKWVAWISIEPRQNLVESCREFVENYAVKVLENLPHKSGVALDNRYEIQASPDLMFSVIIGYQAFLDDVVRCLQSNSAIVRSFSKSLFALGVDQYAEAFVAYDHLMRLRQKLHIHINVSMVVTNPKFPFWNVLEVFYSHQNNIVIVPRGGVTLSLTEKDFELMNTVLPAVKEIKPTVWKREIVPVSARQLKEFEFELERLTIGKLKLTTRQRDEVLKFVLKLEANHQDSDEGRRKRIRYEAFKRLGDFAGTAQKNRYG